MSCLFRSISHFFPDMTATNLRSRICDALERDPRVFGDDAYSVDAAYIRRMRRPGSFGGGIEIRVCCDILDTNIRVLNKRDYGPDIVFRPRTATPTTIAIEWSGNHYEPVRSTGSARAVAPAREDAAGPHPRRA